MKEPGIIKGTIRFISAILFIMTIISPLINGLYNDMDLGDRIFNLLLSIGSIYFLSVLWSLRK